MTPDKIKEAFEGYLDNFVPRVGSVDDSMKRLELERRIWPHWQACAEWMLSQASDGFESWFLESHGYKPEQLVIPESVNPLRKAFIAARLSSAKEIETWREKWRLESKSATEWHQEFVKSQERIKALEKMAYCGYHHSPLLSICTKCGWSASDYFASKKES
jgi:antirestriction protein